MKLSTPRSEKRLLHSADTLHVPEEVVSEYFNWREFLKGPEVSFLRRLVSQQSGALYQSEEMSLRGSGWVGELDPEYLIQLRQNPGLQKNAEDFFKDAFDTTAGGDEDLVSEDEEDVTVLEAASAKRRLDALFFAADLFQIFPESRPALDSMLGNSILAEAIETTRDTKPTLNSQIHHTVALIQVWPHHREIIIQEIMPDLTLKHALEARKNDITARSYADLLTIFPEWRPALRPKIQARQAEFLRRLEKCRDTKSNSLPTRVELALPIARDLIRLTAEKVFIDEQGQMRLEMKKPKVDNSHPLPDRSNF